MSSSLGIAAKCVTTFLDFIHVVKAVNDYNASDGTMLQTANVVNRLMLLGFSTYAIGFFYNGNKKIKH